MKSIVLAVFVIAIVGVAAFSIYSLSNSANPASTSTAPLTASETMSNTASGPGLTFNSTSHLPNGCNAAAQTSSSDGYALTIYINSTAVKLGNTMCITAYLKNMNSTVTLDQATAYKANFNFSVIDSSGRTVLVVFCTGTQPPPASVSGSEFTKPVTNFICSDLWNTRASYVTSPNTTPSPGAYQIIALASFPTWNGVTQQNSTGHITMTTNVQVQAAASG